MSAPLPFVTVAMPCLNERDYIEPCVRSALGQDYPADRMEVVVADGGSTDGTLEVLQRLSAEDSRLRILHNPQKIQSAGMNAIIRQARGEVVARMDVHGDYAQDYLRAGVEELRRTGADNVGGAARPRARNWFQKALAAALHSPLGVGGSDYRSAEKEGFVDTVFNGVFRKEVFDRVGVYDPGAITNEDAELNQRILQAGGRIYLSRRIRAWYYPRDSYRGLARQYFRYGMGRARTLLKHRRFPTLRPAIPFLACVGGVSLTVVPPLQLLLPAAIGLYVGVAGLEAARTGARAGWWTVPIVFSVFPVMHVSHGLGFGRGLLHYLRHPDWA
jgi:glycosyltransferase involved in cell wall biosynthesis